MATLGVDLRELFAEEPSITPRYVLWLVEWLSDESAFYASQQGGPKHRSWSDARHLQVSILETLWWANYQRGGGKGPKPKAIPRPKAGKPKRRVMTVAELNRKG